MFGMLNESSTSLVCESYGERQTSDAVFTACIDFALLNIEANMEVHVYLWDYACVIYCCVM
jgi:hypothetical protein